MTGCQKSTTKERTVLLTRLPVFDAESRLWGYELYCVEGDGTSLAASAAESAGMRVANSSYMGLRHILVRGKKIFLEFTETGILQNIPYAVPPTSAVVKIDESIYANQDIGPALDRLKADGFLISVKSFTNDPACRDLYRMADILCIAAKDRRKDALAAMLQNARGYASMIMATQVEDPARQAVCREMGFALFSGPFFKKPDIITLHKMTSSQASRFTILHLLETRDPDLEKLAQGIQADVSVSFRLLAYLNSVAFGFPQKIKSIQHAITMLGWNNIKNWLRVVLISDVSSHGEAEELMLMSARRGKFLELVAVDHDYWGFAPESLHLLGLFSLLDVMLGVAMQEIVMHLPLDARLKSALCGEAGSEYLPLLKLARCFEEARWNDAEQMMQQLNLKKDKVKISFQRSLEWAETLTGMYSDRGDDVL